MGIRRLLRTRLSNRWTPVVAMPDRRAALRLSYLAFKDLITANDQLLEIIADIERRLDGTSYFSPGYVRCRVVECAGQAYRMVLSLNRLSLRRYQELHLVFGGLQKAIEQGLGSVTDECDANALTYRLASIDAHFADRVGGKAAHAGELANRARLPVPDGFAVSTQAFRALLASDALGEEIASLTPASLDGIAEVNAASERVQRLVAECTIPPSLADAIHGEFDRLCAVMGEPVRLSVRSSAVGEDGAVSFAGQYVTVLNVDRAGLLAAYRQVVAGLYSPSALVYRRLHRIPDQDVAMGVLCMILVDAVASGVACSIDPGRPESDVVAISGSWGLGLTTVGGSVTPDWWEVSRGRERRILQARVGSKETAVEARPTGGVATVVVPTEAHARLCLTDAQVQELAGLTLQAERHYGKPQEIEWALDRYGRFFVLQARPLHAADPADIATRAAVPEGHRILVRGVVASSGSGSGPVFRVRDAEALPGVPDGAVLVAPHSSPRFVQVMDRVAGIVTDVGAPTGHMASLAREFAVPAIVGAGNATGTLEDGQVVTVCAAHGAVYEGRVESLLTPRPAPAPIMASSPALALLRQVAAHIVPLTLTDPGSPDFQPRGCRTLHDLARFAHEKAFEEMFRLSDRVTGLGEAPALLAERLPFEVQLIDIGGGIASGAGRRVRAADLRSTAMRALLEGMLHPGLRWGEPRSISVTGFLSVAAESMIAIDPGARQRELGDRSYAIVAESYCNFSSRIGYHFAAIDAYCSHLPSRNYISFRFKGGAADAPRRVKRCEMIAEVLRRLDFAIERSSDLVIARLRKYPREEVERRLDQLGRLVVATRQLDMRMAPGVPVDWFVRAFFEGNYLFDPPLAPRPGGKQP